MNIFVTGQTTLHWGRLEYGNIGNYYVMEPLFAGLRSYFPDADIRTTFQFSNVFLDKHQITMIPMETYWDFSSSDNLSIAKKELELSKEVAAGVKIKESTLYLDTVRWCDVFIDVSGDIWGDNANFLGEDRFEVGLIKDMVAQELGKLTFMLAGSPGPFCDERTKEMAKGVYGKFTYVTNREPLSTELLKQWGFPCDKTKDVACTSFLFNADTSELADVALKQEGLREDDRPIIGMIVCGWNFEKGPFDRWPREDSEYTVFLEVIKYLNEKCNAKVCVLSHSNGFKVPPAPFELIHGRDYPVIKQLEEIAKKKGLEVYSLNQIYSPEVTKAIISKFDMLISGRLHGAVAGLSQAIPTVTIDYGHEPKAHKLIGFNLVIGQERFVADPNAEGDIIAKVAECWENRLVVRQELDESLPKVRELARESFEIVKKYWEMNK